MELIFVKEARKRLFSLIDEVPKSPEPIEIQSKRGSAILLLEQGWRAVHETLYLASIPGTHESNLEGMATPADAMSEEPGW